MKRKQNTQPFINDSINKQIKPNQSTSEYKQFLDKHIRDKLKPLPENFDTWPDVGNGDDGKIINDIAKKANNNPRFNIHKVTLGQKGDDNLYGTELNKNSYIPTLKLAPQQNNTIDPKTIGHELIHANDHQLDNLNSKVWDELLKLRTKYNFKKFNDYTRKKKSTPNDFSDILEQIQDKIDPSRAFAGVQGENARYNIDGPYVRNEIGTAINTFPEMADVPAFKKNTPYEIPIINKKNDINWSDLEKHIKGVLNHQSNIGIGDKVQNLQNAPFFLNRASEFPAYMSEGLTRRWKTNEDIGQKDNKIKRLDTPQRQFISNVLGHIGNAYPSSEYPAMNQYITARKNSVDNTLNQQQPKQFARGGRVKDTDIVDFIEANKKRHSQPTMPNLHHDAIKRGFTIASSDPKEITRLLELSENGTSKQFNDYLLSIGGTNNCNKKPKNMLDKLLEQLKPPKYPKPKNKSEKIADDLGEAMNFGW